MRFLGGIGHLIAGSVRQGIIEIIFAINAIPHMLTGNVISRAVRHHMLIYAASNTILVANVYHILLTTNGTDVPKLETASTEPETQMTRIHVMQANGMALLM